MPATSRAACLSLVGVEVSSKLLRTLADSFKTRNIRVLAADSRSDEINDAAVVRACVVALNGAGVQRLKALRWFAPPKVVVYGLGSSREVFRFSELSINALLESSNESCIRAAVEATLALVSRRLSGHDRVPVVTAVRIDAEATLAATTRNIGYGGMAVWLPRNLSLPDQVTVNFSLPNIRPLSVRASPRWYSGRIVGLRFLASNDVEKLLKQWVRDYSRAILA